MINEIELRLKKLFSEKIPEFNLLKGISPDSRLTELGFNSISFVQGVLYIEAEFSIEFDLDALELDYLNTFQGLINYVETKLKN